MINHRDTFCIYRGHRHLYWPFFTALWWKFQTNPVIKLLWPGCFWSLSLQDRRISSYQFLFVHKWKMSWESCRFLKLIRNWRYRYLKQGGFLGKQRREGAVCQVMLSLMFWLAGVEICWNVLLHSPLHTVKIYTKPIVLWISFIARVLQATTLSSKAP